MFKAEEGLKLGDETMYPHPDKPVEPVVQTCTDLQVYRIPKPKIPLLTKAKEIRLHWLF